MFVTRFYPCGISTFLLERGQICYKKTFITRSADAFNTLLVTPYIPTALRSLIFFKVPLTFCCRALPFQQKAVDVEGQASPSGCQSRQINVFTYYGLTSNYGYM